jgi:hypothetical protein
MSDAVVVGLFTLGAALGTTLINVWLRSQDRKAEAQRRQEDRKAEAERREEDRKERERDRLVAEMAVLRSEGAMTVARAQTFLTEAHPDRLALNLDRENWQNQAKRLTEQWEALRDPIGVLAVRLPSEDGRDLADAFSVALHNVWHRGTWLLSMLAKHQDVQEWVDDSKEWWEKANELGNKLREALHEAG